MKYVPIRKCYYLGKVWNPDIPGDILDFNGKIVPCECGGKDKSCRKCRGCGRLEPPHHFEPVNKKPAAPVDDTDEKEALRAEFEKIGKAFSKSWGVEKLRAELKRAQKEGASAQV